MYGMGFEVCVWGWGRGREVPYRSTEWNETCPLMKHDKRKHRRTYQQHCGSSSYTKHCANQNNFTVPSQSVTGRHFPRCCPSYPKIRFGNRFTAVRLMYREETLRPISENIVIARQYTILTDATIEKAKTLKTSLARHSM